MHPLEPGEILAGLESAGFEAVYRPTESEADLDEALEGVQGLVVTAGGDGTVRAVAARLAEQEVYLTPLPMGTANNIASVLGVKGPPLEIIAGLSDPREQVIDLGLVEGMNGAYDFIESFGCGLYADTLAAYHPEEGKSIARGLRSISETIDRRRATLLPALARRRGYLRRLLAGGGDEYAHLRAAHQSVPASRPR